MTVADYPSALGKRCIDDVDDFDQDDDYETLYGPTDEIRPPPLFTRPTRYAKWTDEEYNDYLQDRFLLPPLPPPSPQAELRPFLSDDRFVPFPHTLLPPVHCPRVLLLRHPKKPHFRDLAGFDLRRFTILCEADYVLTLTNTHHVSMQDRETIFWTFEDLKRFKRS